MITLSVLTVLFSHLVIVLSEEKIEGPPAQVTGGKDGVMFLDKGNDVPYVTWYNRRLHTVNLWTKRPERLGDEPQQLAEDNWYTVTFLLNGPEYDQAEYAEPNIRFSWNLDKDYRTAFTYLWFLNEPLGPERVRYEITTSMFDIDNATTPMDTSMEYTKQTFKLNATHILLWINDNLAIKLFLRDIPVDLGNTKYFVFNNFETTDLYKIYYWDPTVFCWTGCYEDALPHKFHFDIGNWDSATEKYKATIYDNDDVPVADQCQLVNCTSEQLKPAIKSEFARCVRLYHTEQAQSNQRVLLKCTNENYTYTACEHYPDKPCWYETCDNFDLCNSSSTITLSLIFFTLLVIKSFIY